MQEPPPATGDGVREEGSDRTSTSSNMRERGEGAELVLIVLGARVCHLSRGWIGLDTYVGRSVGRACVCVCVCVCVVDRWMDRSTCYVRTSPSWSRTTRVCRLRRTRWSDCGVAKSVTPRRTKHVCAKLFQNDFPPNSSSSLEVTRAKDVAHTAPTTARSLGERTTRERVSGTPFFSAAPRLLQWTAHRSTGRWLRQALQPSRLLLVPRTNLRSRRPAPSSNNRIQGLLRQQQLLISNLLDQQLLVVNPQDQ